MDISKFSYTLPDSLIAHDPVSPRDAARLMVINRTNKTFTHLHFSDLPSLLSSDYVLVFNNTKVFPARLMAKKPTGGIIEIFLVSQVNVNTWKAMHRGKVVVGQKLLFTYVEAEVIGKDKEIITIQFNKSGEELDQFIDQEGRIPLPPYIHSQSSEEKLREEYQTVYAEEKGSIASPTAGLHFTNELIEKLKKKGIQVEYVTLHVGLGTFLPIKESDITKHKMHSENYTIDSETAERLNQAKKAGKKIISVGTTTTRVLETQSKNGQLEAGHGDTNIFIYPPYQFNFIDGLITNFHLPHSTLLALVSSLVSSPNTEEKFESFEVSLIGKAYNEAIELKYRFYSFGDGMLIL